MSMVQDWQAAPRRPRSAREPLFRIAQDRPALQPLPSSLRGEPVGARRWSEVTQLRGSLRHEIGLGAPFVWLILLSLVCLLILIGGLAANETIVRSMRDPLRDPFGQLRVALRPAAALAALPGAPPVGLHALRAAPSLDAERINRVLEQYGSPAAGTGEIWYRLGVERGIDPAYAVAFFIHESGAGTSAAWAGLKDDGTTTHNVGNIICAGFDTCYGRFRDYAGWEEGIADWYRLIDVEYLQWRGLATVAEIIPIYAPSVENNVQLYVATIEGLVDEWRAIGVR